MDKKLNTGDAFPALSLNMVDGTQTSLPGKASNYQVVLFYRGAF